jgi:hypothetical protein
MGFTPIIKPIIPKTHPAEVGNLGALVTAPYRFVRIASITKDGLVSMAI